MVTIPQSAMRFGRTVREIKNPADVLNALQDVIPKNQLRVAAAWHLSKNSTDYAAMVPGKTLFFHESLPLAEMWSDYVSSIRHKGIPAMFALGRNRSAPFTLTEGMQELQLTGDEDWFVHFFRRCGIRDGLYCPFRTWALAFWSPERLSRLPPDTRELLFTLGALAIARIDTLVRRPEQFETISELSKRELTILRLISYGLTNAETAAHLKIGPETVKHHVKRAMRKLKARDRTEAVASAIRQGLMK
jgi:DNA-binding CsgD family transcriptional regulator